MGVHSHVTAEIWIGDPLSLLSCLAPHLDMLDNQSSSM